MTEAADTKQRRARWMRRIALVLAVVWAGYWTYWLAPAAAEMLEHEYQLFTLAHRIATAILALPFWVAAAIPWWRESAGGVVLLVTNFLLPCLVLAFRPWYHRSSLFMWIWLLYLLPMLVLGCIAGFLLLASWWKSRTASPRQASE
jgi:hypothetical protein